VKTITPNVYLKATSPSFNRRGITGNAPSRLQIQAPEERHLIRKNSNSTLSSGGAASHLRKKINNKNHPRPLLIRRGV
jgi:hypothetical protein